MKFRSQRQQAYGHLHHYEDYLTNLMYHVLTQYMLKAGLQRYNEQVKKGVETEFKQINDKLNFSLIKKIALTKQQRADVLQALLF